MSGARVALLESRAQAEAALRLSPRPDVFVTLAPEAAAVLEEAGEAYVKPESLYDEAALCARGDEVLDAQCAWAERVDDWLHERRPDLDRGFRPARWNLFHLKRLFDALLFRAEALRAVERAFAPSEVVQFASQAKPAPDWRMNFDVSLSALCVKPWTAALGVGLVTLPPRGDERFRPPPRRRTLPNLRSAWSRLRREVLLRWPGNGMRVLVRPEYDVPELLGPLRSRGLRPLPLAELLAGLPAAAAGPLAEFPSFPGWDEPARPLGLNLSESAAAWLEHWWTTVVPMAHASFVGARTALRESGVGAVLIPFAESPEEMAVVWAARHERIPVVIYQHGGFAGSCEHPAWEITDLDQADVMLFYGEASAGHYAERLKRYPGPKARPIAVGSARLDALARRSRRPARALRRRLRQGLADSARLVLYFPTMHAAYTRYLCYGEMPDVSHWELQRDLVRLIAKTPGTRLVFRPFEGFFASPMVRLLQREGLDVVVEREAPLADLAEACDAVVCDIPSTGLLEALLAERPTFVLAEGKSVRLTPLAEELLARRAFVTRDPAALLAGVSRWLSGAPAPGDVSDRAFLRAYGTHLDDGRSAERAADAVLEMVRARA